MSTKTGTAPVRAIASAVAINVWETVMTSSPRPIPEARRARYRASVPEPTPTAKREPQKLAKSCSRAWTFSPRKRCFPSRVRATASWTSPRMGAYCLLRSTNGIFIPALLSNGLPAHCEPASEACCDSLEDKLLACSYLFLSSYAWKANHRFACLNASPKHGTRISLARERLEAHWDQVRIGLESWRYSGPGRYWLAELWGLSGSEKAAEGTAYSGHGRDPQS